METQLSQTLDSIQTEMLETAKKVRKERETYAEDWKTFMVALNKQNLVLTPW